MLPVLAIFLLPTFASAGFFDAISGFFEKSQASEPLIVAQNAQTIPLLRAAVNEDPNPSKGGGDIIVSDDGTLVPQGSAFEQGEGTKVNEANGQISVYVVREGDSLSQIAEMFGVTSNTILWANDIPKATAIQPGDTLVILPVSGVRHVIKSGETLKSIAAKYRGRVEDIIDYNQLADASDIAVGDEIVIPGGQVQVAVTTKTSGGSNSAGGSSLSGYFIHPLPSAIKTQSTHGYNGVDLAAPAGTAVRAAAGGEVMVSKDAGWNGGYGMYVVIKHANGTQTLYAHLSSTAVSAGDVVSQGQTIGGVGNTGRSTGNHLHFEVRGARNPF